MIKLTAEEIQYIGLFESFTGAEVKDCVIDESKELITFLVKENQVGKAVGKNGSKIKRFQRMLGRSVEVTEFSKDPETFIKNILAPARPEKIEIADRGGQKIVMVTLDFQNRKLAIGRGGRKIRNAKKLALRHHQIADIVLR